MSGVSSVIAFAGCPICKSQSASKSAGCNSTGCNSCNCFEILRGLRQSAHFVIGERQIEADLRVARQQFERRLVFLDCLREFAVAHQRGAQVDRISAASGWPARNSRYSRMAVVISPDL